jgi:hypothetical protein
MKLYINPHGMGDRLGPSGLLKASLTEPMRQEMQQNEGCYIIVKKLFIKRVSKPSLSFFTFLP